MKKKQIIPVCFGFKDNIILLRNFLYSFKDIILLLFIGYLKKIISNFSRNLAITYNTSIIYIDTLLLIITTICIYYIFAVVKNYLDQDNPKKITRDIFFLSTSSFLNLVNKSLLLNLLLFFFNYFSLTELYSFPNFIYFLFLDDILSSLLYLVEFINYIKFRYLRIFIFSVNPLSSGSGKKDDPIDLTGDDDQEEEEEEEEENNENHSVEYFEDLLKKRDNYLNDYEFYNKKWKESESNLDKAKMEECGNKLDEVELEIEELKEKEGFADPADFLNDPDDE